MSDPDRDKGCWASRNHTPCNQPAATDLGLCERHLHLYRLHPSTLPAVPPPERPWLLRAVEFDAALRRTVRSMGVNMEDTDG